MPDRAPSLRAAGTRSRPASAGINRRADHPSRWGHVAAALEGLLAVGALGGGVALMVGPQGQIVSLPVSDLAGSPFDSYFVPGLILFTVLGLGSLVVARLAWRAHRAAPLLTVAVAGGLLIWIGTQITIVGYIGSPPLQAIYIALALVLGAVGLAWMGHR